ncbi:MAG TPA: O-antigen ligase family protein [Verrucomicrobiae bacterium]|nr:O-antigen ligase family protein [Verrucomicrobiae bacterium]
MAWSAPLIRGVFRIYLCLVVTAVLLSLGNLSFLASNGLHFVSGIVLLLYFLLRVAERKRVHPSLLLGSFAALLLWLTLQQAGIALGFPLFEIPSAWSNWFSFFGLLATGVIVYAVALETFTSREELAFFLKYLLFSSTLLAVYFIYIFYTSGVSVEKIQPPFPLLSYLGPLSGISLQPNNLVDLFIPGFFVALSLIFYNYRRKLNHSDPGKAYSEIILQLCCACVLLAAVLFTKSRAGILSFFVALAFYFVNFYLSQHRKRGPVKFLAFVFVIAILFVSALGLKDVVRELGTLKETWGTEVQTMGVRSMTMGASWQLVRIKGWFGVGLGNFQMGWLLFHEPPFTAFPMRSYNDFLWLWAEMGVPGMLFLMGGFLLLLLKGLRTAFKTSSCFISYTILASLSTLASYMAHSMVDPTLYVEALFVMLCAMLAAGAACIHLETLETQEEAVIQPQSKAKLGVPLVLFALSLPVTVFTVMQVMAFFTAGHSDDIAVLSRAMQMDPTNPNYPRQIAFRYYADYAQKKDPEVFKKALSALDEAIRRDPFNLNSYRKRAEMFLSSGDLQGVNRSIELMQERLPDFYQGEMTAAAFYMDAAMASAAEQAAKFKALALRYYARALDLNPAASKWRDLYPLMAEASSQEFENLLTQKAPPAA